MTTKTRYGRTIILKGGYKFDVLADHVEWLDHLQHLLDPPSAEGNFTFTPVGAKPAVPPVGTAYYFGTVAEKFVGRKVRLHSTAFGTSYEGTIGREADGSGGTRRYFVAYSMTNGPSALKTIKPDDRFELLS